MKPDNKQHSNDWIMETRMKFLLKGFKSSGFVGKYANAARILTLLLLLSCITFSVSAQSVTSWTDSFKAGMVPTNAQATKWSDFLSQLGQTPFIAVSVSGTEMAGKISMNDAASATELARLLSSGTMGAVTFGGHTWSVSKCYPSVNGGVGVGLSIDGDGCGCEGKYVIRPFAFNVNWGGLNTPVCDETGQPSVMKSQTMTVEFNTGVTITASGPTTLCEGGSVKLTASSEKCSAPYTYLWSNKATTEFITVSEPGNYSVTVYGSNNCSGTSPVTSVSISTMKVNAGVDAITCKDEVQLNANKDSGPVVPVINTFCLYDIIGGNCDFSDDLCLRGYDIVNGSAGIFSKSGTLPNTIKNPLEIRFKSFYSLTEGVSTIRYMLNGNELRSVEENIITNDCTPTPASLAFSENEFLKFWSASAPNVLTIEISAPNGEIWVFGLTYEVVSQNEVYSWSPATGLSSPSIKNPIVKDLKVSTPYTVTYTDVNGCVSTDEILVTVKCADDAPVANCKPFVIEAVAGCTASAVAADFNNASTGENIPLKYTIDNAGPYPFGTTNVTFTVTDSKGQTSSCVTTVTVTNAEPEIISVMASGSVIAVNRPVTLSTSFKDNNVVSATINWDDESGVVTVSNPEKLFDVSHTYNRPGLYSVAITLTDACGVTAGYVYDYIVVYNSKGGFVTGGGWFKSPGGAYIENPGARGKAGFGFVAKYKKRGTVPEGKTAFEFRAGNLKFRSQDYQWLVVNDRTAIFKGFGKVNGVSGYEILVSVVDDRDNDRGKDHDDDRDRNDDDGDDEDDDRDRNDDDGDNDDDRNDDDDNESSGHSRKSKKSDKIRVKIWDAYGAVVYDSQPGSPDDAEAGIKLGGGSIQIHKGKSNDSMEAIASAYAGEAEHIIETSTKVYPNPFMQSISLQFYSSSKENLRLQLVDIGGRVIYNESHLYNEDGSYLLKLPESERGKGIYILRINQGRRVELLKLVRK